MSIQMIESRKRALEEEEATQQERQAKIRLLKQERDAVINPLKQQAEESQRRQTEMRASIADFENRKLGILPNTTMGMADLVEDATDFQWFMREYRRRSFVPDDQPQLSPTLRAKMDAYLHLSGEEIRTIVHFAKEHQMTWNQATWKFRGERRSNEAMLPAWHKLELHNIDVDPTSSHVLEIGLRRYVSSYPSLLFILRWLEQGIYQGRVPEEHWEWMCEKNLYDTNHCRLQRLLHEMQMLYSWKPMSGHGLLSGIGFAQQERYEKLQQDLSIYEPEAICELTKKYYADFKPSLEEEEWMKLVLKGNGQTPPFPCKYRHHMNEMLVAMKKGYGTVLANSKNPLLGQFGTWLIQSDSPPFFSSLTAVFAEPDLAFSLYFYLQSPQRERILQCFSPSEQKELIRRLTEMFAWIEEKFPDQTSKHSSE